MPNTTIVVSSNLVHGEVYSIQYYVIKFASELRQVGVFLRVLWFPPPTKQTATINQTFFVFSMKLNALNNYFDFTCRWEFIFSEVRLLNCTRKDPLWKVKNRSLFVACTGYFVNTLMIRSNTLLLLIEHWQELLYGTILIGTSTKYICCEMQKCLMFQA